MRDHYRTVARLARIELEERKSRFIATCGPLETESEALAFVAGVRNEFHDASHHVFAWILGGELNLQRYSDDGEPQGTAGIPVLDALRKQGIDQAGIVVTRYFGGTLLGTGGLSRAYGHSAAQAVEAAGPVDCRLCRLYAVTVAYADLDRCRRAWRLAGYWQGDSRFALDVEIAVAVPVAETESFVRLCADLTQGAALLEPADLIYRPLPPPDPPPDLVC